MKIKYLFVKLISKVFKSQKPLIRFYRKAGMSIGDNCLLCSKLPLREASLITIGSNTVISTDVSLVAHDFCAHNVMKDKSDLFGRIVIGNNCFIGTKSIILYGVELSDNIVVAAGSCVTKSFLEPNIIIGGNPARKIGDWNAFEKKYNGVATPFGMSFKEISKKQCEGYYLVKK